MEVTKTGTGILEATDVYAIQNNASITVENKDVTYSIHSKNFVDTDCMLKDWVPNYLDANYPTEEEFRSCRLSEYPIDTVLELCDNEGNWGDYIPSPFIITGSGLFCTSFTPMSSKVRLHFDYGIYQGGYETLVIEGLLPNTMYRICLCAEEMYDAGSKQYYNRIPYVYVVQCKNNEDESVLYINNIAPDENGAIDTSLMMSPTTIIIPDDTSAFSNSITATYDTAYKVDQHYNEQSVIPQSGTAVAEALNNLVTIMQGSSIDDITAAGVTSKVVILYED